MTRKYPLVRVVGLLFSVLTVRMSERFASEVDPSAEDFLDWVQRNPNVVSAVEFSRHPKLVFPVSILRQMCRSNDCIRVKGSHRSW